MRILVLGNSYTELRSWMRTALAGSDLSINEQTMMVRCDGVDFHLRTYDDAGQCAGFSYNTALHVDRIPLHIRPFIRTQGLTRT